MFAFLLLALRCSQWSGDKEIILGLLCKQIIVGNFAAYVGIFICDTGRETPSVAGVINPGSDGFQKLFFGQEEIAVPVHGRCAPKT